MSIGAFSSLARPYAYAAFDFALAHHSLSSWQNMLENAARIVSQPEMESLLTNPNIASHQVLDLFCTLLKPILDVPKSNFLHLLVEYQRIPILPDILAFFIQLRDEHEKMVEVELISAVPVTPEFQHKIEQHLAKRLQRKISLTAKVSADLIGGAMIRAGNTVFDGSVRGKLNRLFESL